MVAYLLAALTVATTASAITYDDFGSFTYNFGDWQDSDELKLIQPEIGDCSLVVQAFDKVSARR